MLSIMYGITKKKFNYSIVMTACNGRHEKFEKNINRKKNQVIVR